MKKWLGNFTRRSRVQFSHFKVQSAIIPKLHSKACNYLLIIYFFPKKFEFVSLCSFICLQAVYQLSGPVCKATWNGCPSYSASYFHFTLCD